VIEQGFCIHAEQKLYSKIARERGPGICWKGSYKEKKDGRARSKTGKGAGTLPESRALLEGWRPRKEKTSPEGSLFGEGDRETEGGLSPRRVPPKICQTEGYREKLLEGELKSFSLERSAQRIIRGKKSVKKKDQQPSPNSREGQLTHILTVEKKSVRKRSYLFQWGGGRRGEGVTEVSKGGTEPLPGQRYLMLGSPGMGVENDVYHAKRMLT